MKKRKEIILYDSRSDWYDSEECREEIPEIFGLEDENISDERIDELIDEVKQLDSDDIFRFIDEIDDSEVFLFVGSVGRWNGNFRGGNVFENFTDVFRNGDYYDWDLIEDNYGRNYINLYHHDGCCSFEVRRLNERGVERFENGMEGVISSPEQLDILNNKNYSVNGRLRKMMGWI